jgi:cytochrome c553
MKRAVKKTAIAVAVMLGLAASANAGNDFDYCLLCHGANANGNYGIRAPKISGMEPWYLARQLENFVTHGKALYAACVACHGAKGEGNAALQAPALASRSDWYLVTQLSNYRKGLRGADARDTYGAQMRAMVTTLPDEKSIADVVAYINTLK